PGVRAVETADGERLEAPDLDGATARVVASADAAADYFDSLAAALGTRGFTVSRMPILFDAAASTPPADDSAPPGDRYRGMLTYPMLTYNNVLVEDRDGERTVYLPQYGFEALDRAGREAWQALDYAVHA